MKYVIVKPKTHEVYGKDFATIEDAYAEAGLSPGAVDHGVIGTSKSGNGIGYVVFEHGLYEPDQSYCGIAGHLIPGATVLYGFDEAGETIDLLRSAIPAVRFFLGINDIEAAIESGEVTRPVIAFNGEVLWAWPNPQGVV